MNLPPSRDFNVLDGYFYRDFWLTYMVLPFDVDRFVYDNQLYVKCKQRPFVIDDKLTEPYLCFYVKSHLYRIKQQPLDLALLPQLVIPCPANMTSHCRSLCISLFEFRALIRFQGHPATSDVLTAVPYD